MLRPDILALFIPILALMIPIVSLMLKHQQRMAELMHQNRAEAANPEVARLRGEIAELRELVLQQSIAIDNLTQARARFAATPDVQERLGAGA